MSLLLILTFSGFTVLILTSFGTPKFILTAISVNNLQFLSDPCSLLFAESWLLHWLLFRERLTEKDFFFHFKFFDCQLVALTSSGWASLEKTQQERAHGQWLRTRQCGPLPQLQVDPLSGSDLFCFWRLLFCCAGLLDLVVFLTLQRVRMTGVCYHAQQLLTLLLS